MPDPLFPMDGHVHRYVSAGLGNLGIRIVKDPHMVKVVINPINFTKPLAKVAGGWCPAVWRTMVSPLKTFLITNENNPTIICHPAMYEELKKKVHKAGRRVL